jgi:hypothetical protein
MPEYPDIPPTSVWGGWFDNTASTGSGCVSAYMNAAKKNNADTARLAGCAATAVLLVSKSAHHEFLL